MRKLVSRTINRLLASKGYKITRTTRAEANEHLERRRLLLETHNIDLLLDVGANVGQYARLMRKQCSYAGRIVSFEPLSSEFSQLEEKAKDDPKWDVANLALGAENGKAEIQISGNSVSSSMLDMLPSVVEACSSEAAYVGSEEITVATLDSIFDNYRNPGDKVFLKIDTQGYERTVLEGALKSLPHISGIQLEMSLIPFYEGETLFLEMLEYIAGLGFKVMSLEPVLTDQKTGQQLQVDGIFFRE